jgi:hypothetical protein
MRGLTFLGGGVVPNADASSLRKLFWYFSISSYVGFLLVSSLLAIFVSVWQSEFSPMFLFVTDTKPNFSWRVFVGPRSTKKNHVLVNPKVSGEKFHFIAFIKILLGLSIYYESGNN